MQMDPALSLGLALPLVALLAGSALAKARDLQRFVVAVDAYQLLPRGAGRVAAPIVIAVEAAAAAGLLAPALRHEAALVTAALFVLYGGAIAFNLARGRRDIKCGCSFGRGDNRLSAGLVGRNAVLAAASLAATAPVAARPLGGFDYVSVALAALAAAALYACLEALHANAAHAARGARLS